MHVMLDVIMNSLLAAPAFLGREGHEVLFSRLDGHGDNPLDERHKGTLYIVARTRRSHHNGHVESFRHGLYINLRHFKGVLGHVALVGHDHDGHVGSARLARVAYPLLDAQKRRSLRHVKHDEHALGAANVRLSH